MSEKRPYFGTQAALIHESSHDTFDESKFTNWLFNEAGLGVYAHGRIHQHVDGSVFVGDLLHKRGYLSTSDILLMEEQALLSMGEPLSVSSRLGGLTAMEVLPALSTAYGEGSLIGYYEGGVVSFETQEIPRETRMDGQGEVIQKGWDQRRMVTHLLNVVSAVGRYAVAVLPRDHIFRSSRGVHLLRSTTGSETFNSENVNTLSSDVNPILDMDPVALLSGTAVGFWVYGNRYFVTTGLVSVPAVASSPIGRGFVSWNQAISFTEDRTPRPVWEGVWVLDYEMAGVHRFIETQIRPGRGTFGHVCSGKDGGVFLAVPAAELADDVRDGQRVPIEWSLETACVAPPDGHAKFAINGITVELVAKHTTQMFRLFVRTDQCGEWTLWKTFTPADKSIPAGATMLITEVAGKPPVSCREGSWAQVRLEGVGPCEVRLIDLDFSETTVKSGRQQSYVVTPAESDPFQINNQTKEQRWQSA